MPVSAEIQAINLYVGLASPLIGSAIAAGTARLVAGQAWGLSASRCPSCDRRLSAFELVPVVSWVALRGKCRGCRTPISLHYPVVELGAVGVAGWAAISSPPELFVATCLLGWLLIAVAAVDIRLRRQPDGLNLALVATGLGTAAVLDGDRLFDHVLGCAAGYASLVAIEVAYRSLRGQAGIARGQAKLVAGIGAWVGFQSLAQCIFVAALVGIVLMLTVGLVRRRRIATDTAISFGPFLAAGGWLTWLYGPLVF